MTTYRRELWVLAAKNHGVFTVRQAEMVGVAADEVRKLAARGVLQGYGQGVYQHLDVPNVHFSQFAVAVQLAGPGAFIHRESVFQLFNVGGFGTAPIQVATVRRTRRRLPEWVQVTYRPRVRGTLMASYQGIPITTPDLAIRDLRDELPYSRIRELTKLSETFVLDAYEKHRQTTGNMWSAGGQE